jgi:hypothetical protein
MTITPRRSVKTLVIGVHTLKKAGGQLYSPYNNGDEATGCFLAILEKCMEPNFLPVGAATIARKGVSSNKRTAERGSYPISYM